ncbi:PDZ domain-containing protein [Nostocales cyanobacterium LEGE 11386]|nr:PDZ domain-containing protein [Nostocales cyanobacterium LEGE 11386]
MSLFAINVSRNPFLFATNVSQQFSCLQAGAFMFASRNTYTAIRQMLQKLNEPLTRFMSPEEFQSMQIDPAGVGVGLEINQDEKTKSLKVISVLEETPAYNAGILVGDLLIKIDGQNVQGMNAPAVRNLLRGTSGQSVVLTVLRGQQQLEFKITREAEKVNPVRYQVNTISDKKIGYIRLTQFSANAGQEIQQAIKDLEKQRVNGYILDLRSNSGGLLFSSIDIARMWINKGTIVSMVQRSQIEREKANGRALTNKPLVVIVNQGTASGAEILVGALKDNNRGVVVGSKTLGLNTIQSIRPLANGSGLAVTIAKWLTPKGRDISKTGILPDVVVNLTPGQQLAMVKKRSFGTIADPLYSKSQEKLIQLINNDSQ